MVKKKGFKCVCLALLNFGFQLVTLRRGDGVPGSETRRRRTRRYFRPSGGVTPALCLHRTRARWRSAGERASAFARASRVSLPDDVDVHLVRGAVADSDGLVVVVDKG